MKKILILIKKSNDYCYNNSKSPIKKSGLYNSAMLITNALKYNCNVETIIASVVDGNSIDKELHDNKPDVCLIEALWVTPEKIEELHNLHPNVNFIIRIHSKIPFLAMEGIAMEWVKKYLSIDKVNVAFNNKKTSEDLNSINIPNLFLPNIYEKINHTYPRTKHLKNKYFKNKNVPSILNIGCFGAIRPLKNQLNQAVAAIKFANSHNSTLNFYINSSRLEQSGENVYKNLKGLFDNTKHNLIEIGWLDRSDFLSTLETMHLSMQVSITESFNIVIADSVYTKVPVVISDEIDWLDNGISDPNSVDSMVKQLNNAWAYRDLHVNENLLKLNKYNQIALKEWNKII